MTGRRTRARSEFTKAVCGQRYVFAKGKCEYCGCDLAGKRAEFDHFIADGAGGKPTFDNCRVSCQPCHKAKTGTQDVPLVAKVKRQSAIAAGVKTPKQKIESRGFPAKAKPEPKASLPRRSLYA